MFPFKSEEKSANHEIEIKQDLKIELECLDKFASLLENNFRARDVKLGVDQWEELTEKLIELRQRMNKIEKTLKEKDNDSVL